MVEHGIGKELDIRMHEDVEVATQFDGLIPNYPCKNCNELTKNCITAHLSLNTLTAELNLIRARVKECEQLERINMEQAQYIEERRSYLAEIEAIRGRLVVECNDYRERYNTLKQQYNQIIAVSVKNKEMADQVVKLQDENKTLKEGLIQIARLRMEMSSRFQESALLAKKHFDAFKKSNKKVEEMRSKIDVLQIYKIHCTNILKILLELSSAVERINLSGSLKRRLNRYKNDDKLCNFLLSKKSGNSANLNDSLCEEHISDNSDDEKAVTEIENLYLAMADEDGEREKEVDIKNNSTNSHYLENSDSVNVSRVKETRMNKREKMKSKNNQAIGLRVAEMETQVNKEEKLIPQRDMKMVEEAHANSLARKLKDLREEIGEAPLARSIHGKKAKSLRKIQKEMIERRKKSMIQKTEKAYWDSNTSDDRSAKDSMFHWESSASDSTSLNNIDVTEKKIEQAKISENYNLPIDDSKSKNIHKVELDSLLEHFKVDPVIEKPQRPSLFIQSIQPILHHKSIENEEASMDISPVLLSLGLDLSPTPSPQKKKLDQIISKDLLSRNVSLIDPDNQLSCASLNHSSETDSKTDQFSGINRERTLPMVPVVGKKKTIEFPRIDNRMVKSNNRVEAEEMKIISENNSNNANNLNSKNENMECKMACASFVRGNDGDEETELRICVEDELDKSQSNISSVTLSNSGFHCDSSHFLTSMSLKNNNCEYSFAVDDRTYCSRHSSESVLSNKTDSIRKSPENQNKKLHQIISDNLFSQDAALTEPVNQFSSASLKCNLKADHFRGISRKRTLPMAPVMGKKKTIKYPRIDNSIVKSNNEAKMEELKITSESSSDNANNVENENENIEFLSQEPDSSIKIVRDDDGDEEIELKIYVEEEPDKSQDNISSVIQTNSGLLCDSASSLKNNDCVCPFSVDDRADCSRHSSESALSNKIDSIKKSQKSKEKKMWVDQMSVVNTAGNIFNMHSQPKANLHTAKKSREHNTALKKSNSSFKIIPVGKSGFLKKQVKNLVGIAATHQFSHGSSHSASEGSFWLTLMDEIVSNRVTLNEAVRKGTSPPLDGTTCDQLADYFVKYIGSMEVGNMWQSVVISTRNDRLENVASVKERNLLELLHQLSGENQWANVVDIFFKKLVWSFIHHQPKSITHYGRDIRCLLIAANILIKQGSTIDSISILLTIMCRSIKEDSSDLVVSMLCFALVLLPESVEEILLKASSERNFRQKIVAVHLSFKDEFYSTFTKMITPISKTMSNLPWEQPLNSENFMKLWNEAINSISNMEDGICLISLKMSEQFIFIVQYCVTIFAAATTRVIPDKCALLHSFIGIVIRSFRAKFDPEQKGTTFGMYADTRKSTSNFREIEAARFARNLVLSSRLLATFLRPLEMKLLVSFVDIVEEIYKLHQNAAEKMVKDKMDQALRIQYFALNDWLRVIQPFSLYLQSKTHNAN